MIVHWLAKNDQPAPYTNLMPKAMALLGTAGWELVSLHPSAGFRLRYWFDELQLEQTSEPHVYDKIIRAFLKRPIIEGQAVDEPKITL